MRQDTFVIPCAEYGSLRYIFVNLSGNTEIKSSENTSEVLLCRTNSREKHCVKSVRNWSFSGPYFPVFDVNTDQKNY